MAESPFKISVPDHLIDRLHRKLELATLPDELEGAGWDYGVPLSDVKRLVARWSNGYDWRHHEAQLNAALPQFTRPIAVDGHGTLTIHYVHQRSTVAGAIPLLFVHGCKFPFLVIAAIISTSRQGREVFWRHGRLFLYYLRNRQLTPVSTSWSWDFPDTVSLKALRSRGSISLNMPRYAGLVEFSIDPIGCS